MKEGKKGGRKKKNQKEGRKEVRKIKQLKSPSIRE